MAGPFPFPDDESIEKSTKMLNIEHQLEESLRTQKNLYKDMVGLQKDVQASAEKHLAEESRAFLLLQEKTAKYYEEVQNGLLINGDVERKQHYEHLQSLQKEIDNNLELIKIHSQMRAIEADMAKKAYDENNKVFNLISNQMQDVFGLKVNEYDLTKKIGKQIFDTGVETELLAYTLGAVVMMLKGGYELFKKMDTAAWEFRKAMGMTRVESAVIRKDAERLAIDYMAMGMTIDQVYKSYQAIGQSVGGVHNVTKDMARDVSLMASQLGISEETSAGFMRNLAAVSQSTLESQQNMFGLAQSISSAAGVNLGEVMNDVSKASGTTLVMMSRLPNTALRTAIELRHMGTSLSDAAKSSRQLLNFTENIQDEMDASVLLGRSINLQRARELAYNRDIEGSTKEILRIAKSVKFEQLDPFQQEAFARATGKSVDELMKMLQTNRQIEHVRRSGTAAQKAELAAYEKMSKENDAALKARAQDAMYQIRTMANQQRMVQIQNKWNELLAKAQQILLPVIDKLLSGALILVDWAPALMAAIMPLSKGLEFLGKWLSTGTKIVGLFASITLPLVKMGGIFGSIATFVLKLGIGMAKVFGPIGKAVGFLGKFLGVFGKLLGPIGWVIMAFQAISGFITGWNNTTGNWLKKLGGGLGGILEGVIPGFSYIEKFLGWMWSKVGGIAKFLFMWTTPIGLAITAFSKLKGMFPSMRGSVGGLFGAILGFIKKIGGAVMEVGKFLFKWFTPVGLIIQAFKGMKKLMPETFSALGNLFGKIWSNALKVGKFLFMWTTPIGLAITGIKKLVQSVSILKGVFSAGTAMVKSYFGLITSTIQYFKTGVTQVFMGLVHKIDHFFASIINGITSTLSWVKNHIPGASLLFGKGNPDKAISKPVEKKAMAAYIPAVTVSPTGTKIETGSPKASKQDMDKNKSSANLDDILVAMDTHNKLLEKLLAKDTNIKMDGQLLSTTLARQTMFKGGYGVNKI